MLACTIQSCVMVRLRFQSTVQYKALCGFSTLLAQVVVDSSHRVLMHTLTNSIMHFHDKQQIRVGQILIMANQKQSRRFQDTWRVCIVSCGSSGVRTIIRLFMQGGEVRRDYTFNMDYTDGSIFTLKLCQCNLCVLEF